MSQTADLAARYLEAESRLDDWFDGHASALAVPVYSSADVRDAGFKVCPIDLNLFPAGYNNLHPQYFAAAVDAWRDLLHRTHPAAQTICVIPESHTRNTYYLQNVTTITKLLSDAGFTPVVATVDPKFVNPRTELEAADGTPLTIYRAERQGEKLRVDGEAPDVILLNNDLADGWPEALQGLRQPILPPPALGWHGRQKSAHIKHYERLAGEWAGLLEVDPWLVRPITEVVDDIDFHEPDTFGPLAEAVDRVAAQVAEQYARHGVDATPTCFIKDDAGTYGMGILTAQSGSDVLGLNRKQRNKMDRGKGHDTITRVLVQEGVPTVLSVDGGRAEAVMYAVGGRVIGGFRRYHAKRGDQDNLNAPGARFTDLCDGGEAAGCLQKQPAIRLYAGLTRISILAAAYEAQDVAART